ncbi:hypothetical protein BDR26DRAFT_887652 [Obelidium mucronatum]|nr:hypothetical protein BDR26DRAFT_887652 [Obelidium mucronatum]
MRWAKYYLVFVYTCPVLYLIVVFADTFLWMILPDNYNLFVITVNVIANILTLLFDMIMMITFIYYINTRFETTDPRFRIISNYGIVVTCFGILCFLLSALYLCIGFDPFINQLLYCGVLWLFQGIYFVLFGMKVALHFQKMSEAKAKIARLEDALLKVSKDALPSR